MCAEAAASYARRLMGILRSSRSDGSVVYHSPACFADRVGVVGRGRWRVWPDDRPDHGTYFECTGCGNRVHPCNVVNSVTATAFSTRMFAGATSFIASVVGAGDVDDAVLEAATDAVETITPLRYTKERLAADLSAEDLAVRMRGDLILLAEQLQPQGVDALLAQARRIARLGGGPSPAQLEILARGEEYLDSARASSFSRPRARRL